MLGTFAFLRRCIATIKGENRTLWKDVKALELLVRSFLASMGNAVSCMTFSMRQRGVSQRDIELATNAVDNRANSQAEASDSSMTSMIFYASLPTHLTHLYTRRCLGLFYLRIIVQRFLQC